MKDKIKKILGSESWNGVAVNGTPFTQWESNEGFFQLWRESKDEIKEAGFSLYKHEERGWVVTLFGVQEGSYDSYDDFLFNKIYTDIDGLLQSNMFSAKERAIMEHDLMNCETLKDLYSFQDKHMDESYVF